MSIWNRFVVSDPCSPQPPELYPGSSLLSATTWFHLAGALGLSQRELQVVQGVFEDQKEESIAAKLGISPHTVNTYFQRLYKKLSVCSRAQLIVRIMAEHFALASMGLEGVEQAAPTAVPIPCARTWRTKIGPARVPIRRRDRIACW